MQRIPLEKIPFPKYTDKDVINSWKWFMSFIPDNEWQRRKLQIEKSIAVNFRETEPFSESLSDGTLIAIKDDIISWYLYLLDMLINEPHKYEFFQGSRIVPIFKRFGEDLGILKSIGGIKIRLKELIKKRRIEADALLFEMLTALLWAKNDYQVSFIPEKNGEKSPDLIAKKNGKVFKIECKRQSKTSDYTYKETEKRQKMISYIGQELLEKNILLEIEFKVEIESLPDNFLKLQLAEKLENIKPGNIILNEDVKIDAKFVDILAIKKHLKKSFVKHNSPMLNYLIANQPIDNLGFTCGVFADFFRVGEGEVNNLFISDISNAYGVLWKNNSKDSIWKKARDIKNQLNKAIKQFDPNEETAIIHIGMETFDGPSVEKARFDKISNTISKIDPEKTNLRWIFCHFFQSYSPPDENWVFDETVSTLSAYDNSIKPPLTSNFMIVPQDIDFDENLAHWEKPLP